MPLLVLGYLTARLTAKHPQVTGKNPWGDSAPGTDGEKRDLASWKRATHFLTGGLTPTSADMCPAIAVGALTMLPVPGWWGKLLNLLAMTIFMLAMFHDRRDLTLTRDGLDAQVRQRRVKWAKTQVKPILLTLTGTLILGVLVWAFTGLVEPAVMLACLCGLPMRKAHKAARLQAKDELTVSMMLHRWLNELKKPPAGRPGRVSDVSKGEHGEWLFMLDCADGGPRAWTVDQTRTMLAPIARQDGMLCGFAVDGDETTRLVCAIHPADQIPAGELMADKTGWQCRLTVDEHRVATKFASFPGRITNVRQVASHEGKPAAWWFDVSGTNADWTSIALNWFPGRQDEWGDWGWPLNVSITVDKSNTFAWLWAADADPNGFDWDAQATSEITGGDPMAYLSLMARERADKAEWEKSLAAFKLDPPVGFNYQRERRLTGPEGWVLELTVATLPRTMSVLDYMRCELAPAFGDSLIAQPMPEPDGSTRGAWSMRFIRFARMRRGGMNSTAPTVLDGLTGTDPASGMMATILMTRALRTCLKTPAFVGDATACHKRGADWCLWRMPIQLNGGVTPADVRKAEARIRSMLGATRILWQWLDAGHVIAWAGTSIPASADGWRDPQVRDKAIGLALDDAWAAAGAVSSDGRTPHTVTITQTGVLSRYDFQLPAGLGAEDAYARIDRFQDASRMAYAKRLPTDQPGCLSLLLAAENPLPKMVVAAKSDPNPHDIKVFGTLDGLRSDGWMLPFGTLDDGTTAVLDPHDTPHLLCSGTTGSGKSSVMVTLTRAALLSGWRVAVADPSKGAKDFAPIERKLLAREDTLAGTCALLEWAVKEMRRRRDMIGEAGDLDGLSDDMRPPRLMIVIDEFNSLLTKDTGKLDNPFDDPDIDNQNNRTKWENGLRSSIGLAVSRLLTQARALNIMLLLGAQKLNAGQLDLLPQAGTAKGMLGHVFLGNGDTAGNVSQSNVKEANRLLKQAMRSGGMPKGRGLYERMGRSVNMFQAWWGGAGPDLAAACAGLPDVERLDLSGFMPAGPEVVGVVGDLQAPPVVEASLDMDDMDWTLD